MIVHLFKIGPAEFGDGKKRAFLECWIWRAEYPDVATAAATPLGLMQAVSGGCEAGRRAGWWKMGLGP
jgi:hypothetical protein